MRYVNAAQHSVAPRCLRLDAMRRSMINEVAAVDGDLIVNNIV